MVQRARSTAILARHPELRILIDPTHLFAAHDDSWHIRSILRWLEWAIEQNGDGGVPQLVKLRAHAENNRVLLTPSYPETTGYLLASLIFGQRSGLPSLDPSFLLRMISYLLACQKPSGAFPGPGQETRELAFDTGQVLVGLVAYYRHVEQSSSVLESIYRAGSWLNAQVTAEGSYSNASSWNNPKVYYLRASMGLLHASELLEQNEWRAAVQRNLNWALTRRSSLAWFDSFSFETGSFQNLHGIAYTIEGLLDLGRRLGHDESINAAKACVDAIFDRDYVNLPAPDCIAGHYSKNFKRNRKTISPTGMCQIALCAFILASVLRNTSYFEKGKSLVQSSKRFHLQGFTEPALNGLLPGSWPVTGPYMHCVLPNWPIKFFLDGLYICSGADPLDAEG